MSFQLVSLLVAVGLGCFLVGVWCMHHVLEGERRYRAIENEALREQLAERTAERDVARKAASDWAERDRNRSALPIGWGLHRGGKC